ncbi:MAG TPA: hypothetical protein PK111_04360 [Atribacterota bacterium]|nr:hypothetical protein [Atribacterota bacterium]
MIDSLFEQQNNQEEQFSTVQNFEKCFTTLELAMLTYLVKMISNTKSRG